MKIAVLFDGAGLARLGLERAGHECVGVELDPVAHYLGSFVGSGNCVLGNVFDFDLSGFDAVWASPPCQEYSSAKNPGTSSGPLSGRFIERTIDLIKSFNIETYWVENVLGSKMKPVYNAIQFLEDPIQCRNRVIIGSYTEPDVFRPYKRYIPGVCPAVTATEYKGVATDNRRASRFYGRRLTTAECAYHQGFMIPDGWTEIPEFFFELSKEHRKRHYEVQNFEKAWIHAQYKAIGNGVPVYMAEAFGAKYT